VHNIGVYNIGIVSKLTNIHGATVRSWERRYGFPQPTRTSAGHRLYSQEDIIRLEWVKAHIAEGMPVRAAIDALRAAQEEGAFTASGGISAGRSLEEIGRELVVALESGHLEKVRILLDDAQAHYPLNELILGGIAPALRQIGTAAKDGGAHVATAYRATNFLRYYLLAWLQAGEPSYETNPVLLVCAPGEMHECGLLMFGALLRRLRWPVEYLGYSVPLPDLAPVLAEMVPAAVIFFAMLEEAAHAFAEWPVWLPNVAECGQPLVCYGGQAFVEHPELVEQTEGVYLGNTIEEGLENMDTKLHQLYPGVE